jgi:thioredoxin 1
MDETEKIKKKMMEDIMADSSKSNGWPDAPVEVGDSNFNDFVDKYPIAVIDCWTPWCGPCRMIAPVIEELSQEMTGQVAFGKLNTDENQGTARNFNIYAIPTLLVFKGGQMVDQIVGALPKEQLKQRLDKYVSS